MSPFSGYDDYYATRMSLAGCIGELADVMRDLHYLALPPSSPRDIDFVDYFDFLEAVPCGRKLAMVNN